MASPTAPPITGGLGVPLRVPGAASLTVRSATEWISPTEQPFAGYRFLALDVKIASESPTGLTLSPDVFNVIDQAQATYTLMPKDGAKPAFILPVTLKNGTAATGLLTFEIPWGGNYWLEVRLLRSPVALVDLSMIADAATPAPPTPRPAPRPTPQRTPVTAMRPTTTPRPTSATSSSGWNQAAKNTAAAYQNSARQTYGIDMPAAFNDLYGYECVPGLTPAECTARMQEAALVAAPYIASVNGHLSFMNGHPAAACFRDAYSADRIVAANWLDLLQSKVYPGDLTGFGRAVTDEWRAQLAKSNAFLSVLSAYFSDCH